MTKIFNFIRVMHTFLQLSNIHSFQQGVDLNYIDTLYHEDCNPTYFVFTVIAIIIIISQWRCIQYFD